MTPKRLLRPVMATALAASSVLSMPRFPLPGPTSCTLEIAIAAIRVWNRLLFFWSKVLKKFGLLQIIIPSDARKPYPKPLLKHKKRKWRREEFDFSPDMGGKCCAKKQSPHFSWTMFFSSSGVHKKWGLCFFHSNIPPCLGLWFFFIAEIFGLLSVTSSYMLQSGFRIWLPGILWHYNLHQTKLFRGFAILKKAT